MPKMKSHSGTKKRIRVTGSGKLRRKRSNIAHLMEHKTRRRVRRLSGQIDVAPSQAKTFRRLLGK